jgi:hypothetical protein
MGVGLAAAGKPAAGSAAMLVRRRLPAFAMAWPDPAPASITRTRRPPGALAATS